MLAHGAIGLDARSRCANGPAMKWSLWWWVVLLAIIVLVGWATGSAHTGAAVGRYFAFSVLGVSLVLLVASGFVELRLRSEGVIDPDSLPPAPPPSLRRFLVTCALFAVCGALAIHEAGTDWLAFGVVLFGAFIFGGRLVLMVLRLRRRPHADVRAS